MSSEFFLYAAEYSESSTDYFSPNLAITFSLSSSISIYQVAQE